MNRRNFIGAALIGLTGLMARPAWAALPNSLNPRLLAKAKAAMAQHRKSLLHTDVIGIADYSLHSANPRFHIVDLESGKVSSLRLHMERDLIRSIPAGSRIFPMCQDQKLRRAALI